MTYGENVDVGNFEVNGARKKYSFPCIYSNQGEPSFLQPTGFCNKVGNSLGLY